MPVTLNDIVKSARVWLNDDPLEDVSTGALTNSAGDTGITVADGANYKVGQILEFADDNTFERVKIQSIAGNVLTVKRGHDGTTPQAHAASAVFLVDPIWSGFQVKEAATEVINDELWPWIWARVADTIAPDEANVDWYDLDTTALALIRVEQLFGVGERHLYSYGAKGARPVIFRRNLPTTLVASGVGLNFPRGVHHSTNNIHVIFAAKPTVTTVEDGAMKNVVVYLTVARVLAGVDIKASVVDDPGDESELPRVGSAIRNAAWFRAQGELLREQLHAQLNQEAPLMKEWSR